MFAAFRFLRHLYTCIVNPPVAPKSSNALRFGILGAATIAPQGLILPARSHPEVIVAAVAARDPKKAEAFAKKHGIPIVHKTYDDLIADPSIDCIYVPLPNGLHYEWTLKSLLAGKHVLLEKPSVSNATEAKSLFQHPLFSKPNAPVLLEAFHYRFHPAWQLFMSMFDPQDVQRAEVINSLVAGIFPNDDIRFNYSLSGGALIDFGSYAVSALRSIFASEPTNITSATYRPMPDGFDKKCDQAIKATYKFTNGGSARISTDLSARGGYWFPWLTKTWPSIINALPTLSIHLKTGKEKMSEGRQLTRTGKNIVMHCYMGPHIYHRIDVITTTEIICGRTERLLESKQKTEYFKAYKWATGGENRKGDEWWSTYRYQLEAFVDRVKGRKGSGVWVDGEDSIRQMEMIDATYLKAGLPLRPISESLG